MNYQIIIQDHAGEVRLQQSAEDGQIFEVQAGDQVLVLDENGQPANVNLIRDGSDLIVSFPEGANVTLDQYFLSGGEGEIVHLGISPHSQLGELGGDVVLGEFSYPGTEANAPEGLKPASSAAAESGAEQGGSESAAFATGGGSRGGDDFSLMRFSDLNYTNFGQNLQQIQSNDLVGGSSGGGGFRGGLGNRENEDPLLGAIDNTSGDSDSTSSEGSGSSGVEPGSESPAPFPQPNRPPVAKNDIQTTNEDSPVIVNLLGNDSDPDGDPLQVIQATADNGTVVIHSNGTVTYTPNENFNGTDTITYTVTDPSGATDTATATITVNPVNDNPAAADDVYAGIEDTPFVSVLGVDDLLLNDSDLDGDSLTVITTPVSGPSNGTVTLNADGTFTYTPDPDFNGVDSFVYEVSDGNGGTAQATVTMNVAPVNDPPVAVDDVAATNEDTPILNLDVLGNDSDVDGDPLQFTGVPTAANGTVTVNLDGTINYTPNPDFNGVDTISYEIQDPGGLTDTATVTITVNPVNDAPVAQNDTYTAAEDTAVNGNVLTDDTGAGVDSDVDGDPLSVADFTVGATTYAAGATAVLPEGSLTIAADGSFTFSPAADYNGPVPTTTYTVSDGSLTDTADLDINLTPVNDAPVAEDNAYIVTEDVPLAGNVITDNTGAGLDGDVDGDPLSVTQFQIGAAVYAPGTTVNLAEGDLTVNGDGSFNFSPAADYNGPVPQVTYTLSDGSLTDTAVLDLSVAPVNDAPVATNDLYVGAEDTTLSANVITDNAGGGVDSDVDLDSLSVTDFTIGATTYAAGTTVSLAEGDYTIAADGTLTFVPAADYNGVVPTAIYTLSDGSLTDTATVNISLAAVNDAPVATDNIYSGTEEVAVTGNVITDNTGANVDSDVEGDSLSVTQFQIGAATYAAGSTANLPEGDLTILADGSFTFTPAVDFTGAAPTVTYTLSDGSLTDTADLDINLANVNDAPVATNDVYTTNEDTTLNANVITDNAGGGVDSDVDLDALNVTDFTIGATTYAAGTTVNLAEGDYTIAADGALTFVPSANYNGPVPAATYTLSDGALTDTAVVTISVNSVADPPIATDNSYTGTEDVTLNGNVISDDTGDGLDSDPDGDPISVTQFTVGATNYNPGDTANLAEGDLTINGDGSFSFVPTADYAGPVPVATYTLSDGSFSDTADLTITMTNVNDAPIANNDQLAATLIEPQTINLIGNDVDADGPSDLDISTIDLEPGTPGIQDTLTVAGEGVWQTDGLGNVVFTPEIGIAAQPSVINYTIQDNAGVESNQATIQLEFVTVDIWFGNDVSSSVSPTEYDQSLSLISGTANLIDFGNSIGANAAMFSWAETGDHSFDIALTNNKTQFVNDSGSLVRPTDGGTDIGDAISYGASLITNPANGARAGVPQVLVILTDAYDYQITGDTSLAADAAAAKAAGITLVFLAIQEAQTNPAAVAVLEAAASVDNNGDPLVVTADTYAGISNADMQALIDSIALGASQLPPVVIDLDGDGVEFDQIPDGIAFDVDDDGQLEQTAWASEDDAVLVYDGNRNGAIDDRSEFAFADYSADPNATDLQGLREHFDSDGDLMLTANDAEFEAFHLWQDADGDGLIGGGEFRTLADAEIESIGLQSDGQSYQAANGDVYVHGTGQVNMADGSTADLADASFAYQELTPADSPQSTSNPADLSDLIEPAGSDAPLEIIGQDGRIVNLDAPEPPAVAGAEDASVVENQSPETAPSAPLSASDDALATAAVANVV